MLRRRVMGVAAAVIAVGSIVVVVPPASATNCASGKSCFWRDIGYQTGGDTSSRISFEFYIPNFGSWTYPGTSSSGANSASSVSNEGNFERSYWYGQTSCNDFAFSLGVNTGDGDLTDSSGHAPGGWNNQLESGAFYSYRSSC
ncbi:MAG: hypothetical protein M3279_02055 [Actinomycetota bacterium]|nr:hypothetical protein [Actinomycetota bacterium]